ncbi:MAG TPA: hypothetical protein VMK42_12395 [Anaeromyxobacteraceae bacterium]|nr:hypothetical protein [Anaeromyxobacteraceae bacterium]
MPKAIALIALVLALEGGFVLHAVVAAPVAPSSEPAAAVAGRNEAHDSSSPPTGAIASVQ